MLPGLTLLALLAATTPAAAPSAAPATIEVTGRVLDAQAKPAAKVPVELTAYPSAAESRQLRLLGKTHPETLTATVTDATGRFRLNAPGAGMYRVTVRANGAVPAETALLPLLAPAELPPLQLEPDQPLRVRVLGAEGTTRAGVRVAAWPSAAKPRAGGWSPAARLAISDANGTVVVPRARGEVLELAAGAAGVAEARASRVASAAIDLRLQAACPRQLVVRDENGRPAAGVTIASEPLVVDMTGADGTVTVAAPCTGELRLALHGADGRTARPRLQPVPPGQPTAPLEVTLAAPERFSGRVLDAESRAALPGAFVWTGDDPASFVRTDAKGTYVLAAAAELRAAAAGHLPRTETTAGRRSGPTFALQPTSVLSGTVVDAGGRAVAAAEIHLDEWSSEQLFRFRDRPEGLASRTVSRDDGAFRVEVLPRRAYTLRATHAGFAPATITVAEKLQPGATRAGLKLVLTSGAAAVGTVVDERSQLVAGAEITLTAATAKAALPAYLEPAGASKPERPAAVSDAEGKFRFDHLQAGRFDLEAKASGYAPRTLRGLEVAAGEPSDFGTVTLERGATLTGAVEDERGRAVEGATVSVLPPSRAGIRGDAQATLSGDKARDTTTGADGRFTLDGLQPGETVDVVARRTGFVPATVPQVEIPPSQPLTITLEPAARVSGRVRTEQGEPVPGAVVSVRPADAALPAGLSGRVAYSDAEGAFVVEDLAPGKMALSAAAKDFLAGDPLVLEIAEGRALEDVEITMRRGALIEGVVLTPNGQPASAARVTLRSNWTPDRMLQIEVAGAAQTDGDGRFRMEGVPLGPQTVHASQDGYQGVNRDLEVRNGVNRVDLRLTEGFRVSGSVIDGSGRPVAGAAVTLLTSGPGIGREDVSGGDGAFRFQGLGAGRYTLSANKEGYSAARSEIEVADRALENVELRLEQGGGVISGRIIGIAPQTVPQLQITAVKQPMDNLDALREGQADHQGGYRVDGVYPGEWTVTARLPNGRQAQKSVTVPEGNAAAQADLEFNRGVALSGRVRRQGQAVPNASVQANGVGVGSSGAAVTDGGGAFRIEGLTAGEHRLVVSVAQSGLRHERTVTLNGDDTVDIDLPTARASGQVVDAATSAPLAGVSVTAEPAGSSSPGGFSPRATTDSSGSFELTSLGRGSYRITASKDGYTRGSVPVELSADDASADGLRLTLEPERGLVLDVAGAAGTPSRVTVALLDALGQIAFMQSVSTGENGRTRVASAPAGQFRALVGNESTATVSIAVTIPGSPVPVVLPRGGTVTVEIPELAGGSGSVVLVDRDGQPFRSVAQGAPRQEWPVSNGIAIIHGVPAGVYRIRGAAPGGRTWEGSVTAVDGQNTRTQL